MGVFTLAQFPATTPEDPKTADFTFLLKRTFHYKIHPTNRKTHEHSAIPRERTYTDPLGVSTKGPQFHGITKDRKSVV